MAKLYSRINWVDYPSVTTPMNATNLNKMDKGIDDLDTKVNSLDTSKANKTQSAWVEPAMINNWVNFGSGWETFGYMKDEFGFVHIKGVIKGGAGSSSNFTLPVGFRPPLNKNFPIISNNLPSKCAIMSDGTIVLTGTNNTSVCFDGITFKV